MKISTRYMAQAAIIAAIYATITLLLAPISYGEMQVRVSEALTLLPILTPAAVPGLFLGCLIANIAGASMGVTTMLDIVIGSLASLIAAVLTRKLRKWPALAAVPPVLVNAIMIGGMLTYAFQLPFWASAGWVGLGQLLACYVLGLPLLWALKKLPHDIFDI